MAVNPMQIMQFAGHWKAFKERHPKLPAFFKAVSEHALSEGAVFELKVTGADGREMVTNMKLTAEDVETINEIKDMFNS
ncbi:MAG: hypothetical protein IKQ71_02420 [Lachnospiraceae bacterium]|nr:hypothetical protein [Lachnospiraceae bacterium]